MPTVVDYLRWFNRKERFFLVGWALGNPEFRLSSDFRATLHQTFNLNVPDDAFAGMDYHLDCIYASIFLFFNSDSDGVYLNQNNEVMATQEDIDFLVAYQDKDYHIIMLEIKGVTGWSNRQIYSKAKRLAKVFGEEGTKWPGVIPHFAIASPREPKGLKCDDWPVWMKPNNMIPWVKMQIPPNLKELLDVMNTKNQVKMVSIGEL
jgi:hypothetical protein